MCSCLNLELKSDENLLFFFFFWGEKYKHDGKNVKKRDS